MACTNFTCINLVIIEVFPFECAVFITDQSVFTTTAGLNSIWILTSLAIVCNVELISSTSTLCFIQVVDIGVVTIAGICQLLHQVIIIVSRAESQGC